MMAQLENSNHENNKMDDSLLELISAACNGPLTEEQQTELEGIIQSDEESRRIWLSFSRLHAELCVYSNTKRILEQSMEAVRNSMTCPLPMEDFDLSPVDLIDSKNNAGASGSGKQPNSYQAWLLGTFAVLAASVMIVLNFSAEVPLSNLDAQEVGGLSEENSGDSIARIVRKVDCDWEGDRWTINSSSFAPGQTLILNRGLMELEFTSGARVTLEAPASFTLESAKYAVLSHGRLTAYVPESAKGFTVTTPRGDIVDLGTKFGLLVKENGDAETHVFEGEVIVRPTSQELNGETEVSLTDEMAFNVASNPDNSQAIDAVPSRFATLEFESDKRIPYPVVDRELSLWFSAEGRVQLDESGRVIAWGDLHSESNQVTEDAWQVESTERPIWKKKSFGNLPAVRFKGRHRLVTEPLRLGSSITAVAVFRSNEELFKKIGPKDRSGLQILNTNGPPHMVIGLTDQMGLFGRMRADARKDPITNKEITFDACQLMSRRLTQSDKGVVGVMVYDSEVNISRLYVNGIIVDESQAPFHIETNSPRYIGGHYMVEEGKYFYGDIAELMVFNTGLDEEEVNILSEALMSKYGFSEAGY